MRTAHDATGVEVFGREGCARCTALGRALAAAGVAYTKRDVDTPEGMALFVHYDLPESLPQVVVDGEWLDMGPCEPGLVAQALAARQRQRRTEEGPQITRMNTDDSGADHGGHGERRGSRVDAEARRETTGGEANHGGHEGHEERREGVTA